MTVVEQLFEEIRKWAPIDDALRMQLEADIQIWLQKEQEQLNNAWQDGAVTAQNDAAKEIEKNYVARVRQLLKVTYKATSSGVNYIMEKVSNKHQTATDVYTVLGEVILAANLPLNQYKIDVWSDGFTYNYIDTETGIVSCSEMVKLGCGCCYKYEQKEVNVKELDMLLQCEILIDLYERYCT